jgi:hypothetical protein
VSESINPAAGNVEARTVEAVRALFLRLPVGTVVSSKEIARTLEISDGEAQPLTRAVIAQVVREGLPLGADSRGYRLLQHEPELRDYLADLEHRRAGIKARMLSTERAFRQYWHHDDPAGPTLERWATP